MIGPVPYRSGGLPLRSLRSLRSLSLAVGPVLLASRIRTLVLQVPPYSTVKRWGSWGLRDPNYRTVGIWLDISKTAQHNSVYDAWVDAVEVMRFDAPVVVCSGTSSRGGQQIL